MLKCYLVKASGHRFMLSQDVIPAYIDHNGIKISLSVHGEKKLHPRHLMTSESCLVREYNEPLTLDFSFKSHYMYANYSIGRIMRLFQPV